jgi:hypothetical protein
MELLCAGCLVGASKPEPAVTIYRGYALCRDHIAANEIKNPSSSDADLLKALHYRTPAS